MAYWEPIDPPRAGHQLIYVLAHPSREAAERAWRAFRNDPEWKKVKAESEVSGKLVKHIERIFLRATDYSPLQ